MTGMCANCGFPEGAPRGLSATALWAHRQGLAGHNNYPHDPSDFRRCLNYLDGDRPDWMRGVSPVWTAYVDAWDELLDLYDQEKHQRSAPRLYARMKELAGRPRP